MIDVPVVKKDETTKKDEEIKSVDQVSNKVTDTIKNDDDSFNYQDLLIKVLAGLSIFAGLSLTTWTIYRVTKQKPKK